MLIQGQTIRLRNLKQIGKSVFLPSIIGAPLVVLALAHRGSKLWRKKKRIIFSGRICLSGQTLDRSCIPGQPLERSGQVWIQILFSDLHISGPYPSVLQNDERILHHLILDEVKTALSIYEINLFVSTQVLAGHKNQKNCPYYPYYPCVMPPHRPNIYSRMHIFRGRMGRS